MDLTPDQLQRFNQIDTDNSGQIDPLEISKMYNFEFPQVSATQLIRAISSKSTLSRADFPTFDSWMMRFYQVFSQFSNGGTTITNVFQAVQATSLVVHEQLIGHLVKKFSSPTGTNFGQFLSICSYILLCGKIMQNFDVQKKGCLNIDYNGLVSLGLWFV